METITIEAIIDHGTVWQITGRNADGDFRSVVGDWRPMSFAVEELGLAPGSSVSVGVDAEGQTFLCEEDTWVE